MDFSIKPAAARTWGRAGHPTRAVAALLRPQQPCPQPARVLARSPAPCSPETDARSARAAREAPPSRSTQTAADSVKPAAVIVCLEKTRTLQKIITPAALETKEGCLQEQAQHNKLLPKALARFKTSVLTVWLIFSQAAWNNPSTGTCF